MISYIVHSMFRISVLTAGNKRKHKETHCDSLGCQYTLSYIATVRIVRDTCVHVHLHMCASPSHTGHTCQWQITWRLFDIICTESGGWQFSSSVRDVCCNTMHTTWPLEPVEAGHMKMEKPFHVPSRSACLGC